MQKEFLSPIKKTSKELTVVILGALNVYRNKGAGPTSLINIDGQNLSYKQAVTIKSVYPLSEIFLTVGYYANQVINNRPDNLRIIENQLYENSGHAEEIRLVSNASLNKKYLIMDGDILPDSKSLLSMNNHGSCILVKNENSDDIGSANDSGGLQILSYGLPNKWCKIAMLQEKEVEIMKKFVSKRDKGRYFLHEVLNYIISHGGNINVVKAHGNIESVSN
jgi:hypothetical protein